MRWTTRLDLSRHTTLQTLQGTPISPRLRSGLADDISGFLTLGSNAAMNTLLLEGVLRLAGILDTQDRIPALVSGVREVALTVGSDPPTPALIAELEDPALWAGALRDLGLLEDTEVGMRVLLPGVPPLTLQHDANHLVLAEDQEATTALLSWTTGLEMDPGKREAEQYLSSASRVFAQFGIAGDLLASAMPFIAPDSLPPIRWDQIRQVPGGQIVAGNWQHTNLTLTLVP